MRRPLKKRFSQKSFTLIELIIVLQIIGIMGAWALPRLVILAEEAGIAADEGVIAGLRSAVSIELTWNSVNNIQNASGLYYTDQNLFTVLDSAPQHVQHSSSWAAGSGVGTWRMRHIPSLTTWYMACPHWDGDGSANAGTEGAFYVYIYGNDAHPSWPIQSPGKIYALEDHGH